MFVDKDFTLNDAYDELAKAIQYNIAELYIRIPEITAQQTCVIVRKGYKSHGNVLKVGANTLHYIKCGFYENGSLRLGSWTNGLKVKVTLLCHN